MSLSNKNRDKVFPNPDFISKEDLSCMPIYYPIVFGGSDISRVRQLFQYGIPCMYSDRITIDPKVISKWMRNGMFSRPASEIINVLEKYDNSFIDNEKRVLNIIKHRAKMNPKVTFKEILQEVRPVYSKNLRKTQTPILHSLWEEFNKLSEKYSEPFYELLKRTDKMLKDKPVAIPFSSYEFKYRLAKIKNFIDTSSDAKAKKVMTKLQKEALKFSNTTTDNNLSYQKDVLWFLNHIRKRSVLKNNEQLKELFKETKSRLEKREIPMPFGRKSFIYDLMKIIEDMPEGAQKEKICQIANSLPTSRDDINAYILKLSDDTNDKIGYRLVWPSMSTIEHLLPRSEGGLDNLENLGIASAIENSDRKSIKFTEQLKLRPKTPIYSQRVIDKLIELKKEGVFEKIKLDPKYISGYAKTVYQQSNRKLKLDLSALKD